MNKILQKQNSGQALVEFVFVFLIFFTIILAILHLGLMSISKSLTNLAAYSACREYVVTYDRGKAHAAAAFYLTPLVKQNFISRNWVFNVDRDPGFGRKITTVIKTKYNSVIFPIKRQEKDFNMEARCAMTME